MATTLPSHLPIELPTDPSADGLKPVQDVVSKAAKAFAEKLAEVAVKALVKQVPGLDLLAEAAGGVGKELVDVFFEKIKGQSATDKFQSTITLTISPSAPS